MSYNCLHLNTSIYDSVRKVNPFCSKNILHLLDFDVEPIPSYYSARFRIHFRHLLFISVHNLPNLSYLNLAGFYYSKSAPDQHRNDLTVHDLHNRMDRFLIKLFKKELLDGLYYSARKLKRLSRVLSMSSPTLLDKYGLNCFSLLLAKIIKARDNSGVIVDVLTGISKSGRFRGYKDLWTIYKKSCFHLHILFKLCYDAKFNIQEYLEQVVQWEDNNGKLLQLSPVLDAVFLGEYRHLELYSMYGFQVEEPMPGKRDFMYQEVMGLIKAIEPGVIIEPLCEARTYPRGIHRQYLILYVLYVFLRYTTGRDSFVESVYIHCGYLLFKLIPDPLITLDELCCFIQPSECISGRLIHTSEHETHFSKVISNVYEPRTLLHLCRCAIRLSLTNNFKLPEGTIKLKLPGKIIPFMNLNDSFHEPKFGTNWREIYLSITKRNGEEMVRTKQNKDSTNREKF